MDHIRLTPFEPSRLDEAVRLSRAVGWPHRRQDWAFNLSLGRGVIALRDEKVVGAAVASFFGEAHAAINLVIVDESLRGAGLGRRLMLQALEFCEGRETRLVATREGLPLYEKLGFTATGAIAQHQALATIAPQASDVEWAQPRDVAAVVDLDRRASGVDRAALFDALAAAGRIAVKRGEDALAGFGVVRDFGKGAVVGPVVADDVETARALTRFLLAARPGEFLRVDTARTQDVSPWLASLGLPQVGAGVAMTRAHPARRRAMPDPHFGVYALASQALG